MEIQNKILNLFLFNNKLKFSEIEKLTGIRSNKLDYHLKKLIQKKVLLKEKENYSLSETSEYLIPYLSEKKSVLPVILIKIGQNKNFFLIKRDKRPYKNLLSLPGGRMLLGEDISDATIRIMKKWEITAKMKKIDSISLEHVIKNKKIIHTFLLILVSAVTKSKIALTNIEQFKKTIISSDYKILIKKESNTQIDKIISKVQ